LLRKGLDLRDLVVGEMQAFLDGFDLLPRVVGTVTRALREYGHRADQNREQARNGAFDGCVVHVNIPQ